MGVRIVYVYKVVGRSFQLLDKFQQGFIHLVGPDMDIRFIFFFLEVEKFFIALIKADVCPDITICHKRI